MFLKGLYIYIYHVFLAIETALFFCFDLVDIVNFGV